MLLLLRSSLPTYISTENTAFIAGLTEYPFLAKGYSALGETINKQSVITLKIQSSVCCSVSKCCIVLLYLAAFNRVFSYKNLKLVMIVGCVLSS